MSAAPPHERGPRRSFGRTLGTTLSVGGEILGIGAQIVLIWLGWLLLWGPEDGFDLGAMLTWCLVATLYLSFTIFALNILVRVGDPNPAATRVLVGHPLTRALSTLISLGASAVGLSVAIDLITSIGQDQHEPVSEFIAVWAMLLSWAMFNWGYARVYFSRYHRAASPPLEFPGTPDPRLVDFVYLAFTNATTFAVSDVKVVDSRMRWTIVWHTTLAFFFNALIIVLTMNVIANGKLFAQLFA
ncbi:DUF1345 domain-containing protein [Leucobacter chromiireducens]|uniref:DUF1345 domain-containing protein n=1 Tax=Leucobacter chromiireducens TaxID=283877 RepID=UPI003F803BED